MQYNKINLISFKGNRAYGTIITNDNAGFQALKKYLWDGGFAYKKNRTMWENTRANLDNLILYLDACYCSPDQFIDNLLTDLFYYNGEKFKALVQILMNKKPATNADFNNLEII